MAVVSQTTVENILLKMIRDLPPHPDRAELHVSTRQTFRHRDQIRNYFPMIDREPLSGTTKSGHDFVGNQENPVLIAKRAQALHVTVRRNKNTVCTDDRLDDQCRNRLRSFELQHLFSACEHVFRCVPTSLNAVIVIRNADRKSTRLNSSHSSISYA